MIELLIGLAVIAGLALLLLPTLASARKAGEMARCTSNLKSLGVAIHAYTAENKGFLPSGYSPMEGTIVKALSRYTGGMKEPQMAHDLFYCPTNERLGSPPVNGYPNRGASGRYKGFAGYFMGYVINGGIHPIRGEPSETDPNPVYRYHMTEVKIPAKTVSLLDLMTRAPTVTAPPSAGFAKGSYFNPASTAFNLGLVHNGKGNILFIDGHVESFNGNAPLPVQSLPNKETTWW